MTGKLVLLAIFAIEIGLGHVLGEGVEVILFILV